MGWDGMGAALLCLALHSADSLIMGYISGMESLKR